jgi:hypothetical protein
MESRTNVSISVNGLCAIVLSLYREAFDGNFMTKIHQTRAMDLLVAIASILSQSTHSGREFARGA